MTHQPQDLEIWFLTGSQHLYGPEVIDQVAEHAAQIVAALDASPHLPVRVVAKPVLTETDSIRRALLDATATDACVGVIAWMHTFSPAKMWITGLDALRKPLLHLHTQANQALPWAEIDMDFMNLNQAAHGDREFASVQTRLGVVRKTVTGHVEDPEVARRIGVWARAALGRHAMTGMRLARFGDNMRNVAVTDGDKVEAERRFGVAVNTWGVNDLVAVVDTVADEDIDKLCEEYADTYEVAPELLPSGERHESLRYGARIEVALRTFLTDGGFTAFTTNFEDLGGLRQLPGLAVQRLMADGYGFGAEGDWKTSVLLRTLKVAAEGLPGGTSFMEDYTYHLVPGEERILGAHMLEVCTSIAQARPSLEIHPRAWRARGPGPRVFDATPAPAWSRLSPTSATGPLRGNEIEVVPPTQPLPTFRSRGRWRPTRPPPVDRGWLMPRAAPHGAVHRAQRRAPRRPRGDDRHGARADRRRHHDPRPRQGLKWSAAYHRLALGL